MTWRRLAHALTIAALGAALGAVGGGARVLVAAAPCTAATYSSHVTLVVEHGDGSVIGLCVGFDGSSITGEQILKASGVEYAVAGYGSLGDAVCQIDSEPTAYSSCLPSSGAYWVVFVSGGDGSWQPASSGISTLTFASGDAEGFRYDPQSGADPPPASPAGISRSSSSPVSVSAPASPSSAPAGGATASAAAVIGPVDGPRTSTATSTAGDAAGAGISPALLVAAVLLGALAGLAVVQVLMRRRRA